jgi:hypothetical protein
LIAATADPEMVKAFSKALAKAGAEAKPAFLRLLGVTGSPDAFATVRKLAAGSEGAVSDTALRVLCEWPGPADGSNVEEALPFVMDLAAKTDDDTLRTLAVRGAVRLLKQDAAEGDARLDHYAALTQQARSPEERKLLLSGLAALHDVRALEIVFQQFADDAVRAEAVQAAVSIARELGKNAEEAEDFFNGKDLRNWEGDPAYWSVEDGAIKGHSDTEIPRNTFLWSKIPAADFYLAADVKLLPPTANSGIQFRSKSIDEHGQALGYQADIGKDVWGRLYHEHGRGKLDWTGTAEAAVKPGGWNRFEVLAVGPAIWTAINGTPGVACADLAAQDEDSGRFAFQVHKGPPQTVHYRNLKLVHNPPLEMAGLNPEALIKRLHPILPETADAK